MYKKDRRREERMGLSVNITEGESKNLRALFGKKRRSDDTPVAVADQVEAESGEREEKMTARDGKRKQEDAAGARLSSAEMVSKKARASTAASSRKAAAQVELEGASVQLLVLDQFIPKKTKDGAARLFGKTKSGASVVVYITGFTSYFYFPAPMMEDGEQLSKSKLSQLAAALNHACADKVCL